VRVARGKARGAQYAQRVLYERLRDVAQQPLFEIRPAAVWVDDAAVCILCHGVDGEVPPEQVVLQRDCGVAVHDKTGVPVAPLALGARQRVFFLGFGMQEHREILAHLLIALPQQIVRPGANDYPVAFHDRIAQQGIADRAANQVDFHAGSVPSAGRRVMAQW